MPHHTTSDMAQCTQHNIINWYERSKRKSIIAETKKKKKNSIFDNKCKKKPQYIYAQKINTSTENNTNLKL